MKRYFVNLLTALFGRNPYQQEIDRLTEEMGKAAENVDQLRDQIFRLSENAEQHGNIVITYQTLVENLRSGIADRDELMSRMEKDYERRINEYKSKLAAAANDAKKKKGKHGQ